MKKSIEKSKMRSFVICILVLLVPAVSYGQQRKRAIVCRSETFTALKPLPELIYECPDDITNESDDRILKTPERIKAIDDIMSELGSFNDKRWWESDVRELNACYLRGKPGALNAEERAEFTGEEYQARLLGNNRIRLVLTPDPRYQTYYNGSSGFLLYRKGPKVYVTKVLDGYYSRLAKSVFLKFPRLNSEQVIEIETVNISGMRPETTSYYFVINHSTNQAVPRKFTGRAGRSTRSHTRK